MQKQSCACCSTTEAINCVTHNESETEIPLVIQRQLDIIGLNFTDIPQHRIRGRAISTTLLLHILPQTESIDVKQLMKASVVRDGTNKPHFKAGDATQTK